MCKLSYGLVFRVALACVLTLAFAATLGADSFGVTVNGTCEAGSCPAPILAFNSASTLTVDFGVTLADGDEYVINGTFTGSNDGDGGGFLANHDFRVTYAGNANGGPSAADTIIVGGLYSFQTTLASVGEGRAIIGSFGPTIAASSSASSCVNGTVACLGPFTPPGSFEQSSGAFTVNSSGGAFAYDPTWTSNFGAGSAVGSYILYGQTTAAPTLPVPTSAPEPASAGLIALSLVGIFIRRRAGRAPHV